MALQSEKTYIFARGILASGDFYICFNICKNTTACPCKPIKNKLNCENEYARFPAPSRARDGSRGEPLGHCRGQSRPLGEHKNFTK